MKTLPITLLILIMSLTWRGMDLYAQPSNDLIENAINMNLGPVPYVEENVDFPNATNTNDHTPPLGCALSQPGVWYKFTATREGSIGAGIILPSSPVVVFFEGPAEGVTSGMDLIYVDQPTNECAVGSTSSIIATPGTTYYIYMKNNVASNVFINTANVFQSPENDLVVNATNLNGLQDFFENDIHFLMATNEDDGGQQGGCNTAIVPVIWYKFTAQSDGEVIASLGNPQNQSVVIFYTADDEDAQSGADLTWVDQATNECDENNWASIEATANTTYYVLVTSLLPYGDFSINLSEVMENPDITVVEFNHYPNPVNDRLYFTSKNHIDSINLYTISGQRVLINEIGNSHGWVDMSHLPTGVYLAEIISETGKTTAKILKK